MSPIFKDLVIFEMANNHQGSLEHGLNIVRAYAQLAQKYNLRAAVKLQYRDLPDFIHPDFRDKEGVKHVGRFLNTMLTHDEMSALIQEIKRQGLISCCTPFDEASVELCLKHEVEILKIASCSALDWPLNENIAKTDKPVIISTGGLMLPDIDKLYSFFNHRNKIFALLHCTAMYPAPDDVLQLNWIDRLKKRYPGVPIGYSGHEAPNELDAVKIALAKGADILERHVGLPAEGVALNAYSMNQAETEEWLKAVVSTRIKCGGEEAYKAKITPEAEKESLLSLTRGVFASAFIKKGQTVGRDDVFFAMPRLDGQLESGRFRHGIEASREYSPGEALYEDPPMGWSQALRLVLHEAKGMLAENMIAVGDKAEFELSHHYGVEKFRQWGAIIINIVNREYCKKLILMLPDQRHPAHLHKIKEETFHVLAGELEVTMDTENMLIPTGGLLTVCRNAKHSFSTKTGVVFEEISTSHVKNDSYYEDDAINILDPLQRKTILKNW